MNLEPNTLEYNTLVNLFHFCIKKPLKNLPISLTFVIKITVLLKKSMSIYYNLLKLLWIKVQILLENKLMMAQDLLNTS